ncbi:hypothetical protein [Amycolatopsis sp. H20-H5]|uniref:hypothetical protein n=1 Tax=Amycolatopsis sp. H20-H5 TaxID=3046309 RepID=UPI002DBC3A4F|nr:hypothetical protein [Amycolatopsis sp. H20-H5]MEC3979644.1 hypothetical protein [Amycolatopsis sp. H20-H5]
MNHETRLPVPDNQPRSEGETSARFGYLLNTDPAAIVDMWKMYNDRIDAEPDNDEEIESTIDFHDAEDVGAILAEEFPKLAKAHPRRAAELVAEILRREDPSDGSFPLWTNAPLAILYIASRDRELASKVWEMFRELGGDYATREGALYMREEIDPRTKYDKRTLADQHAERMQGADRVAMILFYLEHVKAYDA